jgi:hypothetical protein
MDERNKETGEPVDNLGDFLKIRIVACLAFQMSQ